MINFDGLLPPDWRVTHLIVLDDDSWQANITDGSHVVVATDTSIEAAVASAGIKALDDRNWMPKYTLKHEPPAPKIDFAEMLGLIQPRMRRI